MNNHKSLFYRFAEVYEQYRAEQRESSSPMPRQRRLGRTLRWFLPNGGTLLLIALLILTQNVWARQLAAPSATSVTTIPYQGRLADINGNPVTGRVNMEFRLYDVPTGGTPLWEEHWTGSDAVNVSDGLFSVMLGSLNPDLVQTVQGHDELYLEITVGTDYPMEPRVQLGSVPFSVWSLTVADGSITTDKIADGAVTTQKLPQNSVTKVHFASDAHILDLTEDDQWHDDPKLSITADFTGGSVLIELNSPGTWCYNANKAIDARILIDGVEVAKARTSFQVDGGYAERQTNITWVQEMTPGTHSIQVQWKAMSGTDSKIGVYSTRTLTVLELKR